MARGRKANLVRGARKAFNKVAATRGGERCGRSRRGARRQVCLSVAPLPGVKCGKNPINKLYACVAKGRGRR